MNFETESERHEALVRYLLDDLSDEERDRVETHLLTDRGFQDDLLGAEEELADLYVRATLPPDQRELLRRKFAGSPEWDARVHFERTMSRVEADLAARDSGGLGALRRRVAEFFGHRFRGSMVVVVSLAALLIFWFTVSPSRRHIGVESAESGHAPDSTVASFLLTPAGRKGVTSQPDTIVQLPARSGPVELRLILERDLYSAYRVRLQLSEGRGEILVSNATPTRRNGASEIDVAVDSTTIKPGRYTIVLQASETDGNLTDAAGYSFRVQ